MRDMVVLLNLDDRACRSMARRLRAEHLYCRFCLRTPLPRILPPRTLWAS